jgi:ornithine cyclodeaminase/alanine dehydrogenase-like protein (mu-crystallin family)
MAVDQQPMKFLYLSHDDVLKVGLTMAETMDLCAQSFTEHARGKVENPPKPGVHPLPDAFIHAMPGMYVL